MFTRFSIDFPGGPGSVLLMVRRREVKVDPAKGLVALGLTEDDRNLFIQRDSMTKIRAAILISLDRLFHQRHQRALAFLGRLVEAYDVLLECLHGFRDFRLKGVNRHGLDS